VPFRVTPPAAAFVRNEVLWMVFDTKDIVEATPVPQDLAGDIARIDVDRAAGASILRITMHKPQPVRFAPAAAPQAAAGWTAKIGDAVGTGEPAEQVLLRRAVADNGRSILKARMPPLGQVVWLDDPDTGDRMGVVTALGPVHGLAKGQSFVELQAQPTVHGIVLSPRSDDIQVQAGLDDVTISRDSGLTVSLGVSESGAGSAEGRRDLLLDVATSASAATRCCARRRIRPRTNARRRGSSWRSSGSRRATPSRRRASCASSSRTIPPPRHPSP
jgi:hypothetical protein